jgi:hypothetical protein
MADDIMPEEAARRRALGEAIRRNLLRAPELNAARQGAAMLRGAAQANLPGAAAAGAYLGRREARSSALAPFEEEGRIALEEARAARAINRAARGRAMPGVGEGGTLQDLRMAPPDEMAAATSRLRGTRTRNQDAEGTEEAAAGNRLSGPRMRMESPEGTDEAAAINRLLRSRIRSQDAEGTDEAADASYPIRGAGIGEGGTAQGRRSSVPNQLPDMAPPPYAETTNEMRDLLSRRAAEREAARNRPNTRGRPRETAPAERDTLEQVALGAVLSDMMKGGDVQPAEDQSSLERALGRIGLRRTNETGEGRPSTGNFREDLRLLGKSLGLKKGGKVKKMASGGVVKSSASRRGDGIAARGKTKGRMV